MARLAAACRELCLALIPALGMLWLLDLHQHLGVAIVEIRYLLVIAGLATAAALLIKPLTRAPGGLDFGLALLALAAWCYAAWRHPEWELAITDRSPTKSIPAFVAVALTVEATRRHCGAAMTVLVVVFLAYGLFGHRLPGLFEATYSSPAKFALYLYDDSNGIPGLILQTGATLVLGFMLMGKIMERGGATRFFNDAALAAFGRRRGGAGKVEVVASSVFGTINGTTVGNIMGTGIITIPLMKAHGFKPHQAAAVEAVSSNGGQLAPPVMGTTAFLIAQFLEKPYAEIALAAIIPALVYYLVLFVQIDRFAAEARIGGLAPEQVPRIGAVMARGWAFLVPLALLVYLLFWLGFNPGKTALYVAGLLLLLNALQARRVPTPRELWETLVGAGKDLAPLLVICAAAGIVTGVLNITGLGLQLVAILTNVAQAAGLFVMLLAAAAIAIVLGMGMPTAAVYIVMSVVLAPALTRAGVEPLAAHFFLFYFGMLSMLTPPVAIASYVAAGLAGADMWKTSLTALKLAASGYLLPFLFVYNPSILLIGAWHEIAIGALSAIASGWVLAYAIEGRGTAGWNAALYRAGLVAAGIAIGAAPVVLGAGNWLALVPTTLGLAAIFFLPPRTYPNGARP
jgi:TRAP transporter 4TM/12TM fusion protein